MDRRPLGDVLRLRGDLLRDLLRGVRVRNKDLRGDRARRGDLRGERRIGDRFLKGDRVLTDPLFGERCDRPDRLPIGERLRKGDLGLREYLVRSGDLRGEILRRRDQLLLRERLSRNLRGRGDGDTLREGERRRIREWEGGN